jgi:hypothetical protein
MISGNLPSAPSCVNAMEGQESFGKAGKALKINREE